MGREREKIHELLAVLRTAGARCSEEKDGSLFFLMPLEHRNVEHLFSESNMTGGEHWLSMIHHVPVLVLWNIDEVEV